VSKELKKEWREQLEDLIAKYKTDISDGGYFDLVDGYIPLESFISSLLAKQQEGFVKMLHNNRISCDDFTYQDGWNDCIEDIKSKLNK